MSVLRGGPDVANTPGIKYQNSEKSYRKRDNVEQTTELMREDDMSTASQDSNPNRMRCLSRIAGLCGDCPASASCSCTGSATPRLLGATAIRTTAQRRRCCC